MTRLLGFAGNLTTLPAVLIVTTSLVASTVNAGFQDERSFLARGCTVNIICRILGLQDRLSTQIR